MEEVTVEPLGDKPPKVCGSHPRKRNLPPLSSLLSLWSRSHLPRSLLLHSALSEMARADRMLYFRHTRFLYDPARHVYRKLMYPTKFDPTQVHAARTTGLDKHQLVCIVAHSFPSFKNKNAC